MSATMTSLDMGLPIPIVGVELGPTWALNINACLTIIDSHDHTAGNGVLITPNGLNINTDLNFLGNGSTNLKYTRFNAQGSPLAGALDVGELYVSGVDLYYNDISGNQIRMTIAGGVNAGTGSISNMTPPASATYVAGNSTFVWQSAVNTAANMDFASIILRNLTLNSFGLTLSPPNAMGADYTITLPTLPASQSIMTIDNAGNIATPAVYPLPISAIVVGAFDLKSQIFNSSGTWTAPAGITEIIIYGTGGGGGGGGGSGNSAGGGAGGGGAGSMPFSSSFSVTPLSVYTITIGTGGIGGIGGINSSSAGTSGGAGGDTNFNGILFFRGALPGVGSGSATNAGGAGSVMSVSGGSTVNSAYPSVSGNGTSFIYNGGNGGATSPSTFGHGGGGGGAGGFSNGGDGGLAGVGSGGTGGNGISPTAGGGGGGGGSGANGGGNGGAGGNGQITIIWG